MEKRLARNKIAITNDLRRAIAKSQNVLNCIVFALEQNCFVRGADVWTVTTPLGLKRPVAMQLRKFDPKTTMPLSLVLKWLLKRQGKGLITWGAHAPRLGA
jgi:hypothetical protein